MNQIAPRPEPAIRDIPLCRLALAPENVRKTPPDESAETQLRASIKAHGLLKNLVARPDEPDADGIERFAVVAGGRRLAALQALAEDGTLHADHPVPCKIAANGDAVELSLAENVSYLPMHPADQVVAFSELARSGATVAAMPSSRSPSSPAPGPPSPPSPRASASPSASSSSAFASATRRPSCWMPTGPSRSTSTR